MVKSLITLPKIRTTSNYVPLHILIIPNEYPQLHSIANILYYVSLWVHL